MDLRDHPGAAGVESLAKAAALQPRGDLSAYIIAQIHLITNLSVESAAILASGIAGLMGVVGLVLAGSAGMGRRGAMYSGMIAAVWAMTHTYAILTGKDALSYGFASLGVGLCWWGFRQEKGAAIALGATALPLSIGLSEAALPAAALGLMGPLFSRRKYNKSWLWLPVVAYCTYWSWAWFWPAQTTRLDTSGRLNWESLEHGLSRIIEFRERGMPEGKFLQIAIGGIMLLSWHFKRRLRLMVIWGGAALIVALTAHYLGVRARPRYIGPAAIGLVAALGWGLAVVSSKRNRTYFWLLPISIMLFATDSWAFFGAWAQKREVMMGANPTLLPKPPTPWRWQYRDMPDITHRDLSLTGGVELAELVQSGRDVATTRLRDERHRALTAFAAISNQRHVILDPGACCAGRPVNLQCAEEIVEALDRSGFDLMLPVEIEGVERIYRHESKWINALIEAAAPLESSKHWHLKKSEGGTAEPPCQNAAPFRSEK